MQLEILDFPYNQISGPLPSQWSKMPKLLELNLRNNSLSGALAPCEFPRWRASFLSNYNFHFTHNKFSGRLELPCLADLDPCYFEIRPRLDELVLNGNNLCGVCDIKC